MIKSLHGDIFLGYEFILRFGKFIALGFASYDKFASLNINSYPKNSNHVTGSILEQYNINRYGTVYTIGLAYFWKIDQKRRILMVFLGKLLIHHSGVLFLLLATA